MTFLVRIAAPFVALALVACASVGRDFSLEDAKRVELGMSEAQVLEIMGEPTNTSIDLSGELWMWIYVTSTVGSPPNSKSFAVKLKDGKVIHIQR